MVWAALIRHLFKYVLLPPNLDLCFLRGVSCSQLCVLLRGQSTISWNPSSDCNPRITISTWETPTNKESDFIFWYLISDIFLSLTLPFPFGPTFGQANKKPQLCLFFGSSEQFEPCKSPTHAQKLLPFSPNIGATMRVQPTLSASLKSAWTYLWMLFFPRSLCVNNKLFLKFSCCVECHQPLCFTYNWEGVYPTYILLRGLTAKLHTVTEFLGFGYSSFPFWFPTVFVIITT